MSDLTPDALSASERKDQLIEAIYRIALDSQSYDAFMDRWDHYVAERVETQSEAGVAELESHFAMASRLLEETMPPPTTDGQAPMAGGDNRSAPRFLVDDRAKVVWYNAAAERLFGFRRGDTIDRLALAPDRARDLRAMAASLASPTGAHDTRPQVFTLGSDKVERPLHFQARVITESSGSQVIMVSKLATIWPPGIAPLLRENFGLTQAEIDVCEGIADGHGPAEIADLRGASVATVRTQIKKIMGKTRVTAQPELVRLLHLLARIAEDNPDRAPLATQGAGLRRITLRDGRIMPVEIHGPENGTPVIFFHGMLDGNAITGHCRDLLFEHGLRFYCPARPWFGAADPDEGDVATSPDRFAQDVLEMMREMDLDRPVLLGHMGGALYAFATAAAAGPGRIAGIVSVAGGVPIVSQTQFASMSARQRVVAYTARYTPRVLPFVLRAGIRQMRSGGERKFLMSLYENSTDDLPVVNDPEVQDIVLNGYRYTTAQGHRAFEIDSRHVVSDWSAYVDGSDVPIRVIHGQTDPVVSAASVEDFAARYPDRATLTMLEDTGQLVFYRRPDTVIQAIRALRNQLQS